MQMNTKHNIYCVYDKLSGLLVYMCLAENDTLAVRNTLSTLRFPLKDTELYCIGSFSRSFEENQTEIPFSSCETSFLKKCRFVPWSCYKFPETVAEALSPLECEELIENVRKETSNNSLRSKLQNLVDNKFKGEN